MLNRIVLIILFTTTTVSNAQSLTIENQKNLNDTINQQVRESFIFNGLAIYLNQLSYYLVDENIQPIDPTDKDTIILKQNQWFAIVGRFNVLVIQAKDTSVSFTNEKVSIKLNGSNVTSHLVKKDQLANIDPLLDQIRYQHLWYPFAQLAKLSEASIVFLKKTISQSWGLAILMFAVIVKLLLLPISLLTVKYQRKVSEVSTKLEPKLKEIKSKYDGEEAHNHLMQAHKDLGVSPFYAMKPMMSTLIQIPILIAVFNALGEMSQFSGVSFLWIKDLAYPENIMQFSVNTPLLGSSLNLLPFLMVLVTIISTILFSNSKATPTEMTKQKRNLYIMGFVFFILFYPFPAAMVMYWMFANVLQIIQQKFIKI